MSTHADQLPHPRRTYLRRAATVLSAFSKAPSQVASLWPSSRALVNAIADRECIRAARMIVDLGPGTGGTTSAILKYASSHCRVLAIEKTAEFIAPLEALGDARLVVEQGDAMGLERMLVMHDMTPPDVIVSGIPFSSLPSSVARSIVAAIHRDLADNGTFIAYQLRGHVAGYAEPKFGKYQSKRWVLWNLPPLRVFAWKKAITPAQI